MTVRDDRGDVKQTTTGFRGPLMVQSLTSAKSKFLSLADFFDSVYYCLDRVRSGISDAMVPFPAPSRIT